jgi:vitamin B12 transporter
MALLPAGCVLAMLATPAMAAEAAAPDGHQPITVTAARTAGLAALGGVAVDTRAFERLAAPTALEALDRLPGVRAFAKGGAGGGSFLSVRGGEPNFTLVLLEGVRLNDPTNSAGGAFDFAQLDPALLGGAELVRGALSAVHGADALAGVVNLRLPRPRQDGWGGFGQLLGSTAGEAGLAAGTALRSEPTELLLAGAGWRSGGLTPGSRLRRAQGVAHGRVMLGPVQLDTLALASATGRDAFPEDGGGPRRSVLRATGRRDTRLALGSVGAAIAGGGPVNAALRLSVSRQIDDSDTPAIAPGPGAARGVPAIAARSRFDRLELTGDLAGTLSDTAMRWAAGASLLAEAGEGRGAVDLGVPVPADFRLSRRRAGGFAELKGAAGALSLTAGARIDGGDGDRIRATGRGAARLSLGEGWSLRAGVAQGFRLPSLYALAYPLIANPGLRPERGRSGELALEAPLPGGQARLALFDSTWRDLIDFDPERFTNVNRARVRARGVEADLRARALPRLELSAAASFTDARNRDGPPLRARPRWSASALAEWQAGERLLLWAQGRYVGQFGDFSVPTGPTTSAAHTTLDMGARRDLGERLALEARILNLTGADHEDAVGFPAPGRRLLVTLRARP